MLRKLLVVGWLFGVPAALVGYSYSTSLRGSMLDVGPHMLERIRPGMSVNEAKRLVGGSPGDYRCKPGNGITIISGCCWDWQYSWTTCRGTLTVVDGSYWAGCTPANLQPTRSWAAGSTTYWSSDDGLVDEVRWEPAIGDCGHSSLTSFAAVCFAANLFVYALFWLASRQPPTMIERAAG